MDLIVGLIKTLQLKLDDHQSTLFIQKMLGQILLHPPNVAGWSGGKNWIDNATLLFRLNLAGVIFQTTQLNLSAKPELEDKALRKLKKKIFGTMDLSPIMEQLKNEEDEAIYSTLKDWLIPTKLEIKKAEIDRFTRHDTKENYIKTMLLRLMSLPEYQMC